MFDQLSEKLDGILSGLKQRGVLTEPMIREGLREIRRVLLEADVNFQITREFLKRVEEKALGERVLKAVSPGQQLVKVVHEELTAMLGEKRASLAIAPTPPTVIMMVGLQGSGKTTTTGKLARRMKREMRQTRLVACDVYRPAAVEQLQTLGEQVGVPVYAEPGSKDVLGIAKRALETATRERDRVVIFDTAGRLQIDEEMMDELRRLKELVRPTEILFVADGMTGQEAVKIAEGFNTALDITGVVLTKMDGDARGGAALSIYGVTGKPIKFLGVGEKLDGLEEFHPERMAGRILQMGDVLSLVEQAQRAFDQEQAAKLERKMMGAGRFDLEDFLTAMRQLQNLGPLENLLKLLPGVNSKMLKNVKVDPKRMKHLEAIILSMTPDERKRPEMLTGQRRARIARGSGRPVQEVNQLLAQFKDMQKLMKQMKALQGMMPKTGMPRLPMGGGMPFGRR
ncbi:MAG TPA: signal recognition particle protein [Gemmatimonadaceae bacterium]|nr:signal recognition particle protein [Gemmatimonadaceae bacterium]